MSDLRQQAPGLVLAEIPLTSTLPQATDWLPPGARPPVSRNHSGTLELRRIDDRCLLSFWHQDGSLLWRESADDRAAAEALAQRMFGVKPERWPMPPCQELAVSHFTVTVTRLTDGGNWAVWSGVLLSTLLMMAGMACSMALGNYLALNESGQTTLGIIATLALMLPAAFVGFSLPFWIQRRFVDEDELHTTCPLSIGPDGIALDALGQLPWPAIKAIKQTCTEDGDLDGVILSSDNWDELMLRTTGSNPKRFLVEKLLAAWREHAGPPESREALREFRD